MSNYPKTVFYGETRIGDKEIKFYHLDNGMRIISERSLQSIFTAGKRWKTNENKAALKLPSFLQIDTLNPYIPEGFEAALKRETFIDHQFKAIQGFSVEIIPTICSIYTDALIDNALRSNQKPIARQARVLEKAFSKIGVIAWADEVTGFQRFRHGKELDNKLQNYVLEAPKKKQLMFPQEWYKQICRLKGWKYIAGKSLPSCVGTYTNKLIYNLLPTEVAEKLNEKYKENNKKAAKHLFTTPWKSEKLVQEFIRDATGMMENSGSWETFLLRHNKKYGVQLTLLDYEYFDALDNKFLREMEQENNKVFCMPVNLEYTKELSELERV